MAFSRRIFRSWDWVAGHSNATTSVPTRWERFVFFMIRPPETRDHPRTWVHFSLHPLTPRAGWRAFSSLGSRGLILAFVLRFLACCIWDDLKAATPTSLALRAEAGAAVGFLTATHTNSIPAA